MSRWIGVPSRHRADRGAIARLRLGRWLAWALGAGAEARALPRIPTLRVDEGGFDGLRSTETGRERAERWWAEALAATPADAPRRRRRWRR